MAKGEQGKVAKSEEPQNPPVDLNKFVEDALEDIMSKEEQTYDDLLKGFMFLKKEQVSTSNSKALNEDKTKASSSQSSKATRPCNLTQNKYLQKKEAYNESSENISDEELAMGPETRTGSLLERSFDRSLDRPGTTLVQLDNYIEDEVNSSCSEESDSEGDKIDLSATTMVREEDRHCLASDTTESPVMSLTDSMSMKLPGEAEDFQPMSTSEVEVNENNSKYKPNLRHLQFTATASRADTDQESDTGNDNENDNPNEICKVTEFALDEDFDYDNVPLTRKFEIQSTDSNR